MFDENVSRFTVEMGGEIGRQHVTASKIAANKQATKIVLGILYFTQYITV